MEAGAWWLLVGVIVVLTLAIVPITGRRRIRGFADPEEGRRVAAELEEELRRAKGFY